MVKAWSLFALLLCVAIVPRVGFADSFALNVDKKSSVLGEPLLLELRAEDAREPLSVLNLDELKLNFQVHAMSSNVQTLRKKGRSIRMETLALTLYPLRSGRLSIPAFSYRGKRSKGVNVEVAESGAQTPRVIFRSALDTAQLHVRQAATLTLDIYDDGSLQWNRPADLHVNGAHLRRLAESQSEETLDGNRYTLHRYAWAVMPLREGKLQIDFPMLEAMKFGTRLRYAVPAFAQEINQVPLYLPVHVPIGKLQLEVQALPDELELNRPVNWVLSVRGGGISAEGLAKLLPLLLSNEEMRVYPLKIAPAGEARPVTAMQRLQVTIPFVPLRAGLLQMPEIALAYYDPDAARVESVVMPAHQVKVVNPIWGTLGWIMLALLSLLAVLFAGYWLYHYVQRQRALRRILNDIAQARSTADLSRSMLDFGVANNQSRPLTLRLWLAALQQRYIVSAELQELVRLLEQDKYGRGGTEVLGLAQTASRLLKGLKPEKIR